MKKEKILFKLQNYFFCFFLLIINYSFCQRDIDNDEIRIAVDKAKTLANNGNVIAAEQAFKLALLEVESQSLNYLKSKILIEWGIVLSNSFEYKNAHDKFSKAYSDALEFNDSLQQAKIEIHLGNVNYSLGNKTESSKFHNLSKSKILKIKDSSNVAAYLWSSIGTINFMRGQDSAKYYLKKAIVIAEKYTDNKLISNSYMNLASVYAFIEKEMDSASYFYEKAIKYAHKTGLKRFINDTEIRYYSAKISSQNDLESLKKIKEIGAVFKEEKDWENYKVSQYILSEYYKNKNDFKKALTYHEGYVNAIDSLNLIANRNSNIKYKEGLNFIEQKKQLEIIEKQKEIETKNSRFTQLLIIGCSLAIICVLLLLYIRKKNALVKTLNEKVSFQNKTILLKADVELKNKELLTNNIKLTENNTALEHAVTALKKIQLGASSVKSKTAINDLISELKLRQSTNLWTEFEYRFNAINPNFYSKLLKDFPDLTANDKRIAAFIKLNLSTKDIATITKQSINSIDVAKTRLRKKLNCTQDKQDFFNFINNY
ncbi:hypothetical protein [uncultured Lacinutrix sp.]|uniref:helix-turn-helix transcriptional regulator n=1 Tax=uncultured Lacinutrix sp. TaxID=574032 RepID=UPI0026325E07|nr:hypothetical protein [uncultured Lacinutrix sp.]